MAYYLTLDEFVEYEDNHGNRPIEHELSEYHSGGMTRRMEDAVESLLDDIPKYPYIYGEFCIQYSPCDGCGYYLDEEESFFPDEIQYYILTNMISFYEENPYHSAVRDKFWELFSKYEGVSPSEYEDEKLGWEAADDWRELIAFVVDELNENYDTFFDEYIDLARSKELTYYVDDEGYGRYGDPYYEVSNVCTAFLDCLDHEEWERAADLLDTYRYDYDLENHFEFGSHFAAYYAGVPLEDVFA